MASSYATDRVQHSSMIIEGFICPECQSDLSSIEMLQAHFQLVHSKGSNSSSGININNGNIDGQKKFSRFLGIRTSYKPV